MKSIDCRSICLQLKETNGEIAERILAQILEKEYEEEHPAFWVNFQTQIIQSPTLRRLGLITIILVMLLSGGYFFQKLLPSTTSELSTSAIIAIREELNKNFQNYSGTIANILEGAIIDYPMPYDSSIPLTANEEKARQYFFKYAKEANLARNSYPVSRSSFDSYKLSLNSDELIHYEDTYSHFNEVDLLLNDYIKQLGDLESRLSLKDKERVRQAKQLQEIKVIDMQIALLDAAKSSSRLRHYSPDFPAQQFDLFWGFKLPVRNVSFKDFDKVLISLYQAEGKKYSKGNCRKSHFQRTRENRIQRSPGTNGTSSLSFRRGKTEILHPIF